MTVDAGDPLYQEWLEAMQPRLARFEAFQLPQSVVRTDGSREPILRDYSRESLQQLEAFLLERWPDVAFFEENPDTAFIDGAVRYIGETFLRACGGGWHYSDAENFIFRRVGERRQQQGPDWRPRRDPIPGLVADEARGGGEEALSQWVAEADQRIAVLKANAAGEAGSLDLTVESLATLEHLALADFTSVDDLERAETADLVDSYPAHFGSVLIRTAGGECRLKPGDPHQRNLYIGRPFVVRVDPDGDDVAVAPIRSLRALIETRELGTLRRSLEAYARD